MRLQAILSTLAVASLEVVLVLTAARLLYAVIARALERATAGRHGAAFANSSRALRLRARNLLIAACLLSTVGILAYNSSADRPSVRTFSPDGGETSAVHHGRIELPQRQRLLCNTRFGACEECYSTRQHWFFDERTEEVYARGHSSFRSASRNGCGCPAAT